MTRLAIAATVAAASVLLAPAPALAAWTWPLHGEVVTAFRNGDDPYAAGQHRGIDIAGRTGDPVVAAVSGLVRFAGTAGSSGVTVSVRSEDGRFDVSYLHLASLAVRRGERVAAGGAIGTVGTTGVRSIERPHLHFGVREAGSRHAYVDPLTLLPPRATPAPRPPQTVPVAAPAPARPGPAPAPLPAPRAPALRAPLPATRRLPSPGPVPAPAPAPLAGHTGTPHEVPASLGATVAGPLPAAEGHRPHATAGRHVGAHGARLGTAPDVGEAAAGRPEESPHAERAGEGHGPDLGWLAACAGLLAAALALSTGERRRLELSGRAPRARLAALLPALAGRGARTRE